MGHLIAAPSAVTRSVLRGVAPQRISQLAFGILEDPNIPEKKRTGFFTQANRDPRWFYPRIWFTALLTMSRDMGSIPKCVLEIRRCVQS